MSTHIYVLTKHFTSGYLCDICIAGSIVHPDLCLKVRGDSQLNITIRYAKLKSFISIAFSHKYDFK